MKKKIYEFQTQGFVLQANTYFYIQNVLFQNYNKLRNTDALQTRCDKGKKLRFNNEQCDSIYY